MKVTEPALEKFREILDANDLIGSGVRVMMIPSCCSPRVQMSITDHPLEGDVVVTIGGIDFYLEQHAAPLLDHYRINYANDSFYIEEIIADIDER